MIVYEFESRRRRNLAAEADIGKSVQPFDTMSETGGQRHEFPLQVFRIRMPTHDHRHRFHLTQDLLRKPVLQRVGCAAREVVEEHLLGNSPIGDAGFHDRAALTSKPDDVFLIAARPRRRTPPQTDRRPSCKSGNQSAP